MRTPVVLLVDLVCVVAFSTLGRGAHAEAVGIAHDMALTPGGVVSTLLPFLVGAGVGWALPWVHRDPARPRAGLVLVVVTVVIGHAIWSIMNGHLSHWSFILVTIVVLTLLFVGWRLVARLVGRSRVA